MSKLKHVILVYDDKTEVVDEKHNVEFEYYLDLESFKKVPITILNYSKYFMEFIKTICK